MAALPISDTESITQQLVEMGFDSNHIQQAIHIFKVTDKSLLSQAFSDPI